MMTELMHRFVTVLDGFDEYTECHLCALRIGVGADTWRVFQPCLTDQRVSAQRLQ